MMGARQQRAIRPAAQPAIGMEQFDMWIFQGLPGRGTGAREALESRVDLEILRISQAITLDDPQTDHLKLAGHGDIKRFFDRVEKARRQFLAIQNRLDRNNLNEAYQLAAPLQQELTVGLFGPKSLLQKTIASTLNEQQLAAWEKEQGRTDQLRAERAVKLFIAQMQRQVPMTNAQRTQLAELIVAKAKSIRVNDQYTQYLLQYHLSEVPREELENLFDPNQMKAIDRSIQQGRAMVNMLKQRGLLNE
jgi:hypothetical protein